MSTSNLPNIDFGSPVIFFDSNPEQQESYIYSFWSSLKSTLKTAWTAEVPPFHAPGKLRVVFWTSDGTKGIKDYELHEYELVREVWEKLFNTSEIKRVLVIGYSGQNPYVKEYGESNTWVNTAEKKRRQEMSNDRMEENKQQRTGKVVDINSLIEKAEEVAIEEDSKRNTMASMNRLDENVLVDV